jgi:hypothetical protein
MVALADWKDPKDYPPVAGTLLPRWHWEFLRRNKSYQQDYQLYERLKGDPEAEGERDRLARKYGLEGIMLDYADPLESLFQSPRKPGIRLVQWQTAWIGEDDKGVLIEGKNEQMDYLDPRIRQHECCVVFNLRHELDPQLDEAAEKIRRLKQRYRERRGRVEDYPYYLRLLDADDARVGAEELIAFFLPGIERLLAAKKLKNDMKEARRLRDIGYQYI